jgi:putative DNA primase/helicase
LHILTAEGELQSQDASVLLDNTKPVLIVEGFTDTAAGTSLGFTTIGKPAANGGLSILQQMPLAGRKVVIIGEHDSGAGVKGMEATFRSLRKTVRDLYKLMPPEGVKDLRTWVNQGLTAETLLEAIENDGDAALGDDIFEDDVAFTIAKKWLTTCKMEDGWPLIRNYRGQWLEYDGSHYVEKTWENLRGDLYGYLDGKLFNKEKPDGTIQLAPYKPSKGKVNDVFDALNTWCPIDREAPTWLDSEEHPAPSDLIMFRNGLLDVNAYYEGRVQLLDPTPAFFSFNMLPYDFDPGATSPLWDEFLDEIFEDDPQKAELLAEWMGYNLVPDMSMEKMMLLTGRPRSGKGTILECLRATLGHEQCVETSFSSLVIRFGFEPLIGKLACLIGDAKSPKARDGDAALEKLLMITGGDPVTIDRKGISQLSSIHLTTRFTLAMNDLPVFSDHAMALETRLNILSFANSFVGKEDFTLKKRLIEEAKQGKLINFALQGLKRLRERKLFTDPATSVEMRSQFRTISTPVVSFLDECCDLIDKTDRVEYDKTWIEKGQLFEAWKAWCERRGRRAGLAEQFGRWLMSAEPRLKLSRVQQDGRRFGVYKGLTLQAWAFEDLLGRPE